jgi:triphosphatase
MELTLLLAPDDAARLPRLPVLKPARTGRSRGQAVRIVWHDTLDRALAADGLALAEHRGVWRLERHRPAATDPWPPATDHRLIEEAAAPDGFTHALPEALTPVVAFEGRRTVIPLAIDGETVAMTILDGVLRSVAAERRAARLILQGPATIVRALVLSLATTLPLSVPGQSLATEAAHLADGTKLVPRRTNAPALPRDGMSIEAAFAHIMGHLTDVMLHLAPITADASTGPEPVHQMRVAVRRARSALALFPPLPDNQAVAEGLRHLGRMLGPARDWDVFMTETAPPVEAVLPDQAGLHALLRAGERRRNAARSSLALYLTSSEFRLLGLELACMAAAEPEAEPRPLIEFAAGVLQSRWKKLSNVGRSLDDLDNPGLHGMRLKAKRLRYAAEFFAPLFPDKAASRFIRRLAVLQERLGVFNDTTAAEVLLRDLSRAPGYAAGLVLGFTASRGARARPKIASAWARFRRREPFWV